MQVWTGGKEHILTRMLVVLLFTSFFVLFNRTWGSAVILLLSLLTAGYMMALQGGRLRVQLTFFHLYLLLFSVFCFLSSIWAWDTKNAVTKGITLLSILLCNSLVYLGCRKTDATDVFLKAIMWGGILLMGYIVCLYGIKGIVHLIRYDERLSEDFFLNSNDVGSLCAFSTVINLYYIMKDRRIRWWNAFILAGVLMISATGSRQALAILAGGLALLLLLSIMRRKTPTQILVLFLLGLLLLALLLFAFSRLTMFSGIYKRVLSMLSAVTGVGRTDRSATTRFALIDAGIWQFKHTPVLGVGMGSGHFVSWKFLNRTYYLHNNYVEILSGGGITGFMLYYSIYAYFFVQFFRYRRYSTMETLICVTLLVMMLLEEYASVTYYAKETYFYFLLCMLEVEKLKQVCKESIRGLTCRNLTEGVYRCHAERN